MRTATFVSVRDTVCHLMGIDPEELQQNQANAITDALNRSVRRGWETDAWWPWTVEETRRWRQTWDAATAYAAGVEVYHSATELYYRALVPDTGTVPGSNAAIWEQITPDAWISLTEPTFTEIGKLAGIYNSIGVEVDFLLRDGRAWLQGAEPDPVKVVFAKLRPVFSSVEWDTGVTYAAGAVRLRGEDAYKALVGNTAVDPATDAATWEKQEFPDVLADYAAQDAYATMLEIDMQTERSVVARAQAKSLLEDELDKVFFQQQQTRRFRVVY